jgi:hypothetical protein
MCVPRFLRMRWSRAHSASPEAARFPQAGRVSRHGWASLSRLRLIDSIWIHRVLSSLGRRPEKYPGQACNSHLLNHPTVSAFHASAPTCRKTLILPDGQIRRSNCCMHPARTSSPLRKNNSFLRLIETPLRLTPSRAHKRGASRSSRTLGAGCGGRGSVKRRMTLIRLRTSFGGRVPRPPGGFCGDGRGR